MKKEEDKAEVDENLPDTEDDFIKKRKRKRFKNAGKFQIQSSLIILIFSLILEAYFVFNYISMAQSLDRLITKSSEINSTSIAETYYAFA